MSLNSRHRWLIRSSLVATIICGAVGVGAARIIFNGGQLQLEGSGPVDPQQGVYVRDSAIAADKFELGKRMERLKEWHKSADVYQEILEKYQDRVVPTVTNEKGQAIKYASVTVAVQERLARWPDEGLTVYKARFEPQAGTLLEQARRDDLGALHRIFSLYFATDSARTAGIRLIDLYLEQGEFSAAAWIGDRLLEWHPGIAAERGSILFRTAVAYHLAGNEAMAAKRAQDLHTNFPNDIGSIAGHDMKFSEAVDQQLASKAPIAAGGGGDSYRMVNGDVTRSAVSTAVAKPGARVWSVPLPGPPLTGQPEQTKQAIMAQWETARGSGATMGVIPAVDRGEMFFQDGYRVYALHLESGVPLAGWNQTYGGARNGQFWLPGQNITNLVANLDPQWLALTVMAPRQHTLTLTDDAVLGVMGQQDMRALLGQGGAEGGTRLVCLERTSGKPRWVANPNDLPNNPGNARNLSFSGSPLVVGDQVYVIARGSSGAGVEDCHLFCYDLPSGKYKWNCYVASSQVAGMAVGAPPMLSNDTLSHPAFASGRVFINTNLGAIAAIDAYSGATAWLTIYPREEGNAVMRQRGGMGGWGWGGAPMTATGDATKPWEFNPAIVQDGKVFVLPNDGRHLLIYDAGTGEEFKRINREMEFNGNTVKLTMLLGVIGEKLIVGGPRIGENSAKIFCLNWTTYTPNKNDERRLDVASTLWFEPFPSILGRPFVTRDSVLVCSDKALNIVSIASGRVVQRFPKEGGEWSETEGPGNLVATTDHVIVATGKNVSVYTDLAGVRQKYESAIAADPNNVEARLVFAELMFNARELKETRKALDDAIGVLGGLNSLRPGPLRDRAFSDSLMFAQKLGAENNNESIALAEELFNRAAAAAGNPSQKVNYRLSRARFIEGLKAIQARPDYPKAVRLYQEILSDPEMRIITLAGEDSSGTLQAGKLAENAINDLIRKNVDRSIYDDLEKEAKGKLDVLGAAGNPDELMALAENYPNSKVASDALMRAADRYEKTGKPRMATQVLRRLNWKYNYRFSGAERAQLIEAMARNYLKVGNTGAALGRLQKGNSLMPDEKLSRPLEMPDGKPLAGADGKIPQTIGDAADVLQEIVQKRAAGAVPDVRIPLPPTNEERMARKPTQKPFEENPIVIPGVQAILESPVDLADSMRTDRIVAWAGRKLACYTPGSKDPRWVSEAITENALGLAWIDEKLVAWGESEVALIDGESGKTTWRVDLRNLPAVDLVVAGGAADGPTPAPAGGAGGAEAVIVQQEIQARNNIVRMQVARRVRPGFVVEIPPDAQLPGGIPGLAAANNNAVADGKERVLHVRPLTDRLIVSTTTGRILAIDLANGRLNWQTRLSASTRQIQETLATDDFTAVRLAEGASVQLVVLDTYNGQQIWRRSFMVGQQNWPMNCVLAPDGMLVWTSAAGMTAQDLYEPTDRPRWDISRQGRSYVGMLQPDQLIVNGTEVLAVSDNGKFIDRRSIQSGQKIGDALSTGSPPISGVDNTVRLRMSGPRLYAVGSKSMVPYNLEQNTATPPATMFADVAIQADDAMITKAYVVLPGQVVGRDGAYTLQAYSRLLVAMGDGKLADSGLMVYKKDITEPAKITSWAAVDGGIYYLTGDERLVFLKGSKQQ